MIGPDEVVRRGLAGRVGAVRIVLGLLGEELVSVGSPSALVSVRIALGPRHRQRSVDLVGGYVVEPFPLVVSVPLLLGRLKQRQRSHDVRPGEGERVPDRSVDMAFGREVYHPVDGILPEELPHPLVVADIGLYESVVRGVLDVREVGQIARIGQLVEVDDAVSGVLVYEQAYHMAPDEAGAARDQYVFHSDRFRLMVYYSHNFPDFRRIAVYDR